MHIAIRLFCLSLVLSIPFGCGHSSELDRKVISGTVTCAGENVPRGTIRFVPVGATRGPATSALIRDGQYRATNRGGVPLGTHRVEIIAQRPTGKKIELDGGQSVEELEQIGDIKYSGNNSPLTAEITADSPDTLNIEMQ